MKAVSRLREEDIVYYELIIIGHTKAYAERAGLQIEKECKECGLRLFAYPQQGLVVPDESWDGSDIFVIDELPGLRVVSEAFRQVVEKHQHTGVEFVPVDEWHHPLAWMK